MNGTSAISKITNITNQTNKNMKIKMVVCAAVAASLLTGCIVIQNGGGEGHNKKCEKREHQEKKGEKDERGEHHDRDAKQEKLMSEAKVSKADAEKVAQAKVPNGTIKDGELEMENGKLQWSFDMTTPDSEKITEVNIDAKAGTVISVQQEAPESEATEADEGGGKSKAGEQDEDND